MIEADLPEGWTATEADFGTVFERPTKAGFRPNVVVAQEKTAVSLVEASSGMLAAAVVAHTGTRVLDVSRDAHAAGPSARVRYGYPMGDDWIVVDQRVVMTGDIALHITGSASVLEWTEVEPLLTHVATSVRRSDAPGGTRR